MKQDLLQVQNLKKYFPITGGFLGKQIGQVKAVDDVSFTVRKGETFGLVGESGCGKSTTGRSILRLIEPSAGTILFDGQDIRNRSGNEIRKLRRDMQIIFQDPFSSLNPRHTVERILQEPLIVHGVGNAKERKKRVRDLLDVVGLSSDHALRYPHQFSGGQRQRIGIARALTLHPKLIIADEPVSALDVSVQSQVLNLMQDLQKEFDLTYLFIAHDLSVVKHMCDRIGVMYLGRLVEMADKNELYAHPKHPYTQALLSAVPIADPDIKMERIILQGDVPNPANAPMGCSFHSRCWAATDTCRTVRPIFQEKENGHFVACHLYGETK
ncbi:UNVERIFIED_CONTAM: oligopeptide transport system ATP-binding protein [Brevibacillus sp. OAP136]